VFNIIILVCIRRKTSKTWSALASRVAEHFHLCVSGSECGGQLDDTLLKGPVVCAEFVLFAALL